MTLSLYNTLSKQKEVFTPITEKKVLFNEFKHNVEEFVDSLFDSTGAITKSIAEKEEKAYEDYEQHFHLVPYLYF